MTPSRLGLRLFQLTLVLSFTLVSTVGTTRVPSTPNGTRGAWTIENLGRLGERHARAYGMNNRGQVVGESATTIPDPNYGTVFHGVVWDSGEMHDATSPAGPSGFSYLVAINDAGIAVGRHSGMAYLYQPERRKWTALGIDGHPVDINKSGAVAGLYYNGETNRYHSFLYRNGTMVDVRTLGGATHATAMNDHGAVVGQSYLANGPGRAFLFEKGRTRDLGTLGGNFSEATDINNHGTIVGRTSTGTNEVSFVYERGKMRAIVEHPEGSRAQAINNRGDVVGQIGWNGAAYLYTAGGQLIRLDQLPEVIAAGWTQLVVEDINDRGWIVGYGVRPDVSWESQAFLLKPPR